MIEAVVWLVVWFTVWAVVPFFLWAGGLAFGEGAYHKWEYVVAGALMVSAVFVWGFSLVMGILQLIAVVQMAVA